jgi:glucose-6-phosphate 1-dehydrogenase
MEPPNAMNAEAVRQEKVKVLRALRPIAGRDVATHTLRGQYGPGVSSGKPVGGYTDDLGGPSDTETFVAIRAHVDNWRWAGVPFYLRTGKRLTERYAEIVIQFSSVPLDVYGAGPQTLEPNRLVICLQPDERLSMTIMTKDSTSRATRIKPTAMSLSFIDEDDKPRQAYHRLILDAIDGDQSLFAHKDEVDAAWAWIDPIIEGWQEFGTSPEAYESGSWGPREADFLLARDDRTWRAPFCSADSEPS